MNIKKLLCGFIALLFLFTTGSSVFAADINLPEGFLITDENGVHASDMGVYGIYLDDLNTGDTVTRKVTIRNLEDSQVSLHMRVGDYQTTGQVNFLDNVHLTLKLDGNLIYSGKLRGDGAGTKTLTGNGADMLSDALDLGKYNMGDYGTLEIEFFIDTAHFGDLMSEKSTADVEWVFIAVKDAQSAPPKTGVIVQYTLYAVLGILVVAIPTFLVLTKKRKKDNA